MSRCIKNIKTSIEGADIGSMLVTWDMEWDMIPEDDKPNGIITNYLSEQRTVISITSVELRLANKIDIHIMHDIQMLPPSVCNIVLNWLKSEVLSITENYTHEELLNG